MSKIDRIALLISLVAILASVFVSIRIYEQLPHIEDEMAFTWQAKLIARGKLVVPTPEPCPKCFLVPFVVDYNGQRFGKYPLGWPVVLALGEIIKARFLINPLLAGLCVWLTYVLTKKLVDERAGLLAAVLTAASPFFLMSSGSLLSHTWSFFLTLAFILAWLDAFTQPNPRLPARINRILPLITAGLVLGVMALTRPLTALAVALPFAVHGLVMMVRGDSAVRRHLVSFGLIAGTLSLLHFAWQFAVTGDPLLNPYTLWWSYDNIGFGPGIGLQEGGYQLYDAVINARFSLRFGASDLFGWPTISWVFMPFGLYAILTRTDLRRTVGIWLTSCILPALILGYALYWIGSWLYGPRYYYEGIYSAVLLTTLGIRWLAGRFPIDVAMRNKKTFFGSGEMTGKRWSPSKLTLRFVAVVLIVILLVAGNLLFYLPARLNGMVGLYDVSRSCFTPFQLPEARDAAPALVFVHIEQKWIEYGCMLDMTSPFMDSEFIITINRGSEMAATLEGLFPGRRVLHYYADTRSISPELRDQPPQ